jgi:extradiol dioxygenase
MKIRGLGYLGFVSPAYAEWQEFGPEIFGTALADRGGDGSVRLRLDDRHHRVSIHPGDRNSIAYIGWELVTEEDYEAAVEELQVAGVTCRPGTDEERADRRVDYLTRFVDPGGFVHELFAGQEYRLRSFVPERGVSRFVTGDQGMGHLVVMSSEADKLNPFLRHTMGFRLSDAPAVPALHSQGHFYRCNPRHHSIAVIGAPGMNIFDHFLLEVGELDDVGIAHDIVRDRGIPVRMTLGRHPTDGMVSFYVETPSGFAVEYGWGGRRVVEDEFVLLRPEPIELWGHRFEGMPTEMVEPLGML